MSLPQSLVEARARYLATKKELGAAGFMARTRGEPGERLAAAKAMQEESVVDLVLEGLEHYIDATARASESADQRSREADTRSEKANAAMRRQGNIMLVLTGAIVIATAFSAYSTFRQAKDIEQVQAAQGRR